jgi:hypothetical protein
MSITVDHRGNATLYFCPWRHHSGAVQVRRILSIARNTRPTPLRQGRVTTYTVVAVEHYSNGERSRVLADNDYAAYAPALEALASAMRQAIADGYAVRSDLERIPRAPRPVRS